MTVPMIASKATSLGQGVSCVSVLLVFVSVQSFLSVMSQLTYYVSLILYLPYMAWYYLSYWSVSKLFEFPYYIMISLMYRPVFLNFPCVAAVLLIYACFLLSSWLLRSWKYIFHNIDHVTQTICSQLCVCWARIRHGFLTLLSSLGYLRYFKYLNPPFLNE